MTAYHGGKYRHGKEIADIIKIIYDKQPPDSIVGYIEPFCGMCGVYRHIVNLLPKNLKYIASINIKA
jgi:site-specific DNA-adenine methylase